MDRKLAYDLGECLKAISDELHKFISDDNFQFGYFDVHNGGTKIIYFDKNELDVGTKNHSGIQKFQSKINTIYPSFHKNFPKILPRKFTNKIDHFSSTNLADFQFVDFFNEEKKRNEILTLIQTATTIISGYNITKPKLKFLFKKDLRLIENIQLNQFTIPFIAELHKLKKLFNNDYFNKNYHTLDSLRLSLIDHHPYSKMWKNCGENIKYRKYLYENQFTEIIKDLWHLQELTQKARIPNLITYTFLADILTEICPLPKEFGVTTATQITPVRNYQKELIQIPITRIDLTKINGMNYLNFFTRDKPGIKQDSTNEEILINRTKWIEFYKPLSEYNEAVRQIPLENSFYKKLEHPHFPHVDSTMQSILKFIHSKFYYLGENLASSLDDFPYLQRLEYGPLSKSEIIKKLLLEYAEVIESDIIKLSISPYLKLPKSISDIFLSGLLEILKNKSLVDNITSQENKINSHEELHLHFQYKIYWDIKKNKIGLKEILSPLYTEPINGDKPILTESDVELLIDRLFSTSKKDDFIKPRSYLNILKTNEKFPNSVINKFFYDLWKLYYEETEPRARFAQLLILAFSKMYKNNSLDIKSTSFDSIKTNMKTGHPTYSLKIIEPK